MDQQVGQRAVAAETPGRLDHAGHQHVLEVGGLTHDHGQGREQAGHFGLHHGGDDGVLTAGERPVERGSGESGLAGDVVDGGLANALAGQAGQGGIDETDPGRGPIVGPQVPQHLVSSVGHRRADRNRTDVTGPTVTGPAVTRPAVPCRRTYLSHY